jgi:hypothetical protein
MPGAFGEPVGNLARWIICLAACSAPAWSATLELLTLNNLIAKSTAIVHGKVARASCAYGGKVIYTHFQVSVLDMWKGAVQGTVDVMVPGGTLHGIRQTYPGAPQLNIGQEYVLFLWTSPTGSTYTMGFTQGVFTLSQNTAGLLMAVQAPTTDTLLDPVTGQPLRDRPISMPLAQLVSAIQAGGMP